MNQLMRFEPIGHFLTKKPPRQIKLIPVVAPAIKLQAGTTFKIKNGSYARIDQEPNCYVITVFNSVTGRKDTNRIAKQYWDQFCQRVAA